MHIYSNLRALLSGPEGRLLATPLHSIRYKLMLLLIILAILPLTMVTLVAMDNSQKSMEAEIIRSNQSRMAWAGNYMDEKVDQLSSIIYSILTDSTLLANLNRTDDSTLALQYRSQQYISDKLTSIYGGNDKYISKIMLYTMENKKLFTIYNSAVKVTNQIDETSKPWNELNGTAQSVNQLLTIDSGKFRMLRSMNRFEDRKIIGGIALDVQWGMMKNVLKMMKSEEAKSSVYVLDSSGNVMYNPYPEQQEALPDVSALLNASNRTEEGGYVITKSAYWFYQPAASGKLLLVKSIPTAYFTQSATSTLHFSLIAAAVFSILAVLLSVAVAYAATKPIIRLVRTMKTLELHKFDAFLSKPKPRKDEIGLLEKRFFSMMERIKELLQIEFKSKIETRTAQLKAMQAQINPHFLHNTLQMIGAMAVTRDVPEIYKVTKAVSEMFRYTIKMKNDLVRVEQEIEHVQNYLLIQKLRFGDRMKADVFVDPELSGGLIPKLSLQPLVENCFAHGLGSKTGQWSIAIHVLSLFGDVEIRIEDNGVGIAPSKLQQIRERLESDSGHLTHSSDSMGLANVHERARLHFGDEYGLRIDSNPDIGTTVTLTLPGTHEEEATYEVSHN